MQSELSRADFRFNKARIYWSAGLCGHLILLIECELSVIVCSFNIARMFHCFIHSVVEVSLYVSTGPWETGLSASHREIEP